MSRTIGSRSELKRTGSATGPVSPPQAWHWERTPERPPTAATWRKRRRVNDKSRLLFRWSAVLRWHTDMKQTPSVWSPADKAHGGHHASACLTWQRYTASVQSDP